VQQHWQLRGIRKGDQLWSQSIARSIGPLRSLQHQTSGWPTTHPISGQCPLQNAASEVRFRRELSKFPGSPEKQQSQSQYVERHNLPPRSVKNETNHDAQIGDPKGCDHGHHTCSVPKPCNPRCGEVLRRHFSDQRLRPPSHTVACRRSPQCSANDNPVAHTPAHSPVPAHKFRQRGGNHEETNRSPFDNQQLVRHGMENRQSPIVSECHYRLTGATPDVWSLRFKCQSGGIRDRNSVAPWLHGGSPTLSDAQFTKPHFMRLRHGDGPADGRHNTKRPVCRPALPELRCERSSSAVMQYPAVMIRTVAIQGYRSLRDLVLPLGQLSVITGANGSGKSSVYRSLRLLADVAHNAVIGSLAREGGLPSTFWAGPETIARSVRQGTHAVEGLVRRKVASLKLGFGGDTYGYSIDLGYPRPPPPATMFELDPRVKRECIWHGPVYRRHQNVTAKALIFTYSGARLLRKSGIVVSGIGIAILAAIPGRAQRLRS